MCIKQLPLIYDYFNIINSSSFLKKYDAIFSAIDLTGFHDKNILIGCTGYSRHSIIKALIVKHLEEIKSIPRLIEFFDAHPVLTEMCGFNIGNLPDPSVFYRFLKQTNNNSIKKLLTKTAQKLIDKDIISINHFIIDSKPVKANTRENNPKNPYRNNYNKEKKPKRNKKAALSYFSYQLLNNKHKNTFFWGYRTHVIISVEGIPLVEETLPNNLTDAQAAKKLIKRLKRIYKFKKNSIFVADKNYDVKELYNLIIIQMKSQAFIPVNPRNQQEPKTFGPNGNPICDANIEMYPNGIWFEGNRKRGKFRCPVKMKKSIASEYNFSCPVNHEKFSQGKQYGCTKHLDITNDSRSQVQRNSPYFKTIYKTRHFIEQYFARLGDREVDQTTHFSYNSIKNQISIAHLSMALVALAAVNINKKDKILCYRSFAA